MEHKEINMLDKDIDLLLVKVNNLLCNKNARVELTTVKQDYVLTLYIGETSFVATRGMYAMVIAYLTALQVGILFGEI